MNILLKFEINLKKYMQATKYAAHVSQSIYLNSQFSIVLISLNIHWNHIWRLLNVQDECLY